MYIGTSTGRGSFESSAMDHAETGIDTASRENETGRYVFWKIQF